MLISDPDYLIHALRLTYLRNVDDPFGPRIITPNPQYAANPYIRASGLADKEVWPELNAPPSPQNSGDEQSSFDPRNFMGFNGNEQVGSSRLRRQPVEPAGMYPGSTSLKYTQTIMGPGRSGGAGMRVTGRRASANRSAVPGPGMIATSVSETSESALPRIRSDSAPTPISTRPEDDDAPLEDGSNVDPGQITVGKRRSSGGSTIVQTVTPMTQGIEEAPSRGIAQPSTQLVDGDSSRPPLPAFALRFAQSAEMEARRRERLKARYDGAAARAQAGGTSSPAGQVHRDLAPIEPPPQMRRRPSNESALDDSSSSEEEDEERSHSGAVAEVEDDPDGADGDESADDEDEEIDGVGGGMDDEFEGDEFLSAPYPLTSVMSATTASDGPSMLSSGISASQSSAFGSSSLHIVQSVRNRHRLSPVSEGRDATDHVQGDSELAPNDASGSSLNQRPPGTQAPRRPNNSYFIISPPERINPAASGISQFSTASTSVPANISAATTLARTQTPGQSGHQREITARPDDYPSIFARRPVKKPPLKSALTSLLSAKNSVTDNPFTTLYAAMSGRAESSSVTLSVYFPHSRTGAVKATELKIRKDATVEEAIGFGLWTYWDLGIQPPLDEGLGGEDDPRREITLSALGWTLRIAEEDGEVDEDFPALDRGRPVSKFSFDAFAICKANPSQIENNRTHEDKIVRRPSRMMIAKKRPDLLSPGKSGRVTPLPGSGSAAIASSARANANALTPSALSGGPSQAGQVISSGPPVFLRIRVATAADMHYSTTINAAQEEYMADILERVCRKRRIETPKEWALVTADMAIVIPLDRTVASLAGKSDLALIKKDVLQGLGTGKGSRLGRTANPNDSIFKRMSEVPPTNSTYDFTASYKRFAVYRKMPMLVGRHERALAIDGDYIHIMPAATRGLLDSVKTSSYHVKSVVYCKQSKKSPMTSFKLIVWRDGGNKTYDFDAEDSKQAAEIVSSIKNLQKVYSLDRSGTVRQVGKTRRVARAYT